MRVSVDNHIKIKEQSTYKSHCRGLDIVLGKLPFVGSHTQVFHSVLLVRRMEEPRAGA